MLTGVVVWICIDRGFGFIRQSDTTIPDVFLHAKGMRNRNDFDTLAIGDTVVFEIDRQHDRVRAAKAYRI